MNIDEISDQIYVLKELSSDLDDLDSFLDNMTANKELPYSKIMEEVSPEERIEMNWNLSFMVYTLYYSNQD
jgi:hypothetical protein